MIAKEVYAVGGFKNDDQVDIPSIFTNMDPAECRY